MAFRSFITYRQQDAMDCGPTCLRMILKHYGKQISAERLKAETRNSKMGTSLLGLSEAAEKFDFHTVSAKITFEQLVNDVPLPCILHWDGYHFVVLTPSVNKKKLTIADPAKGLLTYRRDEFLKSWISTNEDDGEKGIVLLLTPTTKFHQQEEDKLSSVGWSMLSHYILRYKAQIFQLATGLMFGSLLQLMLPFLAQSVVDTGIATHNLNFIQIILIAQFALFFGKTVVEFVRGRILLFISMHVNLSILSDFWIKLVRLPLSFFDSKQTGDIVQRISDHRRIDEFITGTTLQALFSVFNIAVFSIVLILYNTTIFAIFATGSVLYFLWIRVFLNQRRSLDHKRFIADSKSNSVTMQMIFGMQEIRLSDAENLKRWEWERTQISLFNLKKTMLSLSQYQQTGAFFINESKNILVTYLVAKLALDGQLTIGAMIAVQYILGQLSSPIEQLVGFTQKAQDARMSLERLNEIHQLKDEEPAETQLLSCLPGNLGITFHDFSFTYNGGGNTPVLRNISVEIPEKKITAIVGVSGSGKTTILKALLKFYDQYDGEIRVGDTNFRHLSHRFWRRQCGSVMQEGYIFSDTITNNIAVGDENPGYQKLLYASKIANVLGFIESLPLGFNTRIGMEGNGLSSGQKQRILIARAVYKNPSFIFFDEATNSLDSNNERAIMDNLKEFFKEKNSSHRCTSFKHSCGSR